MFPRIFYSRLKMFYLEFNKCFKTTNDFLHQYFKTYYKALPKNMIQVKKKKHYNKNKNVSKEGSFQSFNEYSLRNCFSPSNFFDKRYPEIDQLNNMNLTLEYNNIRNSIRDRSKIMYIYKRSIANAKHKKKYSQVRLI